MSAKGWCPGVLRPMQVEDGLLMRVKPPMSRLSADQITTLADVARRCGSGVIELTSRANIQLRGITEATLPKAITRLTEAGLCDSTREIEARRQIIATHLWEAGDATQRLHDRLVAGLMDLPALPEKLGIALDTGPVPVLRAASADFRFERAAGRYLLYPDGAETGQMVALDQAVPALADLAQWFVDTRRPGTKRMAPHVAASHLPDPWRSTPRGPASKDMPIGTPLPETGVTPDRFTSLAPGAIRLLPGRRILDETQMTQLTQGHRDAACL